jgi:hypothetical protein
MEADLLKWPGFFHQPNLSRRFKQIERAKHIGLNERLRTKDGAIYMRLSRKMNDGVNLVLTEQGGNKLAVANISLHKDVSFGIGQVFEIFETAGVGQRIEIDDPNLLFRLKQITYKIRTDKPRSASN